MRFRLAFAGFVVFSVFVITFRAGAQQTPGSPAAASSAAQAARSNISPAEEADIHKLMELTGAKTIVSQQLEVMEQDIRPLLIRSLPPGDYRERLVQLFLEKFSAETDPQAVLELQVPIYAKYLSDDEIRGLIQFYQTPLGKKLVLVLPRIAAESHQAGHEWGQELGRKIIHEILTEHPDLARAAAEAAKAQKSQ